MSNATLLDFGHFLGGALAVNLGYSILLRLGNFSGQRIGSWADQQKVRVIPAMAETAGFDAALFARDVNSLENKYKKRIRISNLCAIIWALTAGIFILIALAWAPFCACVTSVHVAIVAGLLLSGATPVGVVMFLVFQLRAFSEMKKYTNQHEGMIRYVKNDAAEKIEELRAQMREQLARARNHSS